jgi:hypothetical protein
MDKAHQDVGGTCEELDEARQEVQEAHQPMRYMRRPRFMLVRAQCSGFPTPDSS